METSGPLNLGLYELKLLVRAGRLGSFRELARQEGLKPAYVTKAIQRLESRLGVVLFKRTASGVALTPEGLNVAEAAEEICRLADQLPQVPRRGRSPERIWGIGSNSFLSTYLVSKSVADLSHQRTDLRFRLAESAQDEIVSHGLDGAFELAVHIGPLDWTNCWQSIPVGMLSWGLFGRIGHPLGSVSTQAEVKKFPFILPTYWTREGFSIGSDQCPLSLHERIRGHETATALTGMEIAARTDQLIFVPDIIARGQQDWKLAPIQVRDWPSIEKPVFLSVREDLVPQTLQSSLTRILEKHIQANFSGVLK